MQFQDIKIIDLDVDKTRPSNKASGLRHMFLKLSELPPREWVQLFENERSFPRHSMWRHAWIEGNYIVVDCVPEEIQQYHLKDLKSDVANSNQKYKEYVSRVEAQYEAEKKAEAEEADRLSKVKNGLDFD